MFPGESPGRSRLALLGRRSAYGGSSEEVDCSPVTKIILFYNGNVPQHKFFSDSLSHASKEKLDFFRG